MYALWAIITTSINEDESRKNERFLLPEMNDFNGVVGKNTLEKNKYYINHRFARITWKNEGNNNNRKYDGWTMETILSIIQREKKSFVERISAQSYTAYAYAYAYKYILHIWNWKARKCGWMEKSYFLFINITNGWQKYFGIISRVQIHIILSCTHFFPISLHLQYFVDFWKRYNYKEHVDILKGEGALTTKDTSKRRRKKWKETLFFSLYKIVMHKFTWSS